MNARTKCCVFALAEFKTPTICRRFPTARRDSVGVSRVSAWRKDGRLAHPRSQLISDEEPGFYRCVSRYVRRAFLCGVDQHSGKSFEYRRQWIEDRIFKLAESFAVPVYAPPVAQAKPPGRLARERKKLVRWTEFQAHPDMRGKLSAAKETSPTIRVSGCGTSKGLRAATSGRSDLPRR